MSGAGPDGATIEELRDRLGAVDARIADAARAAGRDPGGITRIVVTKFHPLEVVRRLHRLGVTDFGENRQQELDQKARATAGEGLRWHFVGQAQSNKARALRALAQESPLVVHSVDRARIADALSAADEAEALDVLLQINLTHDPGRGGVAPEAAEALAVHVLERDGLRLRGCMAVAPLGEEPAAAFDRLADVVARVRAVAPAADWLSAGMSGDFEAAIAIGATHLRIGAAITGNRPPRD